MKKIFLAAAACCLLLTACGNNAEYEALKKENAELKAEIQTLKDNSEKKSEQNTPTNSNDYIYTLSAGDYDISTDLAEGKYDIVAVSGMGVFNVHDPGDGYVISETMSADKADYGIQERKNAKLEKGQTVNITGTLVVGLIQK